MFFRLWVECIIVRPCSQAIVALTFSIYATKPFFPECDPPDEAVRLLAAICICKFFFKLRHLNTFIFGKKYDLEIGKTTKIRHVFNIF